MIVLRQFIRALPEGQVQFPLQHELTRKISSGRPEKRGGWHHAA